MSHEDETSRAGLLEEISELRRRVKELESRPDPFRRMVDSLPQLVFEVDLEGRFTYVNDFALKAYGFTQADVDAGIHLADTIHPDYQAWGMRMFRSILDGTPSPGNEYVGLRKDGSPIPVKVFAQPIVENGRVTGARGVVVDISDIKQVEAALIEREQYYRTLFENTGTAMVVFGDDQIILSCNSRSEELSGYTAEEIEGKMAWGDLVDPADRDRMMRHHQARCNGQEAPSRYDFTFFAKNGEPRRVHLTVGLIPGTGHRICSLLDITDREQAREALRTSEERYEMVVRGSYDGIWDWNLDNGTVYYSPRYKAIIGYDDEAFPNVLASWERAVHPDDLTMALASQEPCLKGEADHFQVEYRLRHQNGDYRWITGRGTAARDRTGRCVRLAGTITDITNWKRTDQALKRSEQRFRDIFTHASDGIFQSLPEGRLITANASMARIMGYDSPEELIAEVYDIKTQCYADQTQRDQFVATMRKCGRVEHEEVQLIQRDGTAIWVLANVRSVFDKAGEFVCFEGFLTDITERKNHERTTLALYAISKAISTSGDLQELYSTIHAILGEVIDATNFYIGVLDPARDRILLPYFEDERDTTYDICNISDPGTKSLTAHVVRTGRPMLVTRDEILSPAHMKTAGYVGTAPAVWLGVPLKVKGTIIGAMAVQHYTNPAHYTRADVAFLEAVSEQVAMAIERKRTEEALTQLNEELESKVDKRTAELEAKAVELEEANRRLTELDEIKSGLVSSVSHELRTPLTSIRGFAKLADKEFARHYLPLAGEQLLRARGDRIRRNLRIIGSEGERLTRLINDFLDLNRIESGNAAWNDEILNPCDIVQQSMASLSGAFALKRGVRLCADFPPAIPMIHADPDKIKQVLINLLNNACKFTERGEVRVRMRSSLDTLTVSVSDTGIGVPRDELPLIFDKFHKTLYSDTVSHAAKGTGLGLAICKEIVEHYEGSIWVESEPGSGSAFHFSLPVVPNTMEDCSCDDNRLH
ncbi:MAG: PAS domain S-box protein [Pseudodesulfovibrio sp.]